MASFARGVFVKVLSIRHGKFSNEPASASVQIGKPLVFRGDRIAGFEFYTPALVGIHIPPVCSMFERAHFTRN
jgi:hypothetical protein